MKRCSKEDIPIYKPTWLRDLSPDIDSSGGQFPNSLLLFIVEQMTKNTVMQVNTTGINYIVASRQDTSL